MIKKFEELLNEDYFSKLSSRKDIGEVRKENNNGFIAYTVSNAGQMSARCRINGDDKIEEIGFHENLQFGTFKTEKDAQDAADKLNEYFKGVDGDIFYVESIRRYTFENAIDEILNRIPY